MNNIMTIITLFIPFQQLMENSTIFNPWKPKIGQILIKLNIQLHGVKV
jgi:hypothetical protein